MTRCHGPGCVFPMDPNGPSEWFHCAACQAAYDAQHGDRVWPSSGEVIDPDFRKLIAKGWTEGPDPLICINEHLKVSD